MFKNNFDSNSNSMKKKVCGIGVIFNKDEEELAKNMGDEYVLRLELWNNGIINEINDPIPSEEEIVKILKKIN